MSLTEQFDSWIGLTERVYKDTLRRAVKEILKIGLDVFRGWVPIDTEQLKQNITGQVHETPVGFEIRIQVKNIDLSYEGKKRPINAVVLGLILEKGSRKRTGKGGRIQLTRTRNQDYAQAGDTTARWFENAEEMWEERAKELLSKMF